MVAPLSVRSKSLPALVGLTLTLVFAACGDTQDGAGDGGASDVGGRDVAGGDAGSDAADLAGDPTPEEPDATEVGGEPAIDGVVAVYETRAPAVDALQTGGVAASFNRVSIPNPPAPVATFGDCVVSEVDPANELFPDVPTLDAGEIRVHLGADTFTLALEPAADGFRYQSDAPADRLEFFSAGLTARFEADGGADVPAFSGSVSAPAEPVITAPTWGAGTSGTHAVGEDLTIAWAASNRGDAIVSVLPIRILPEAGIAEGNAITCTVADDGSITIPAAALAYLPSGSDFGPNVALTVVVAMNSEVRAGVAAITLNATASHTVIGAIR